jgi:hypothetical protein
MRKTEMLAANRVRLPRAARAGAENRRSTFISAVP